MMSFQLRHSILDTRNTYVDLLWWAGAVVMVTAACLAVFGTTRQRSPLIVTTASDSVGSLASSYVEMRRRVEATLPALRTTSDAAEILGREVTMGTAVSTARPNATQGEVFTPAMTEKVRGAIAADLTRRSTSDRASLMNEVPMRTPRVNEPYPTSEALATFPALLLHALPRLPDDLEYRFMGRDLIIRDSRTNLIVDYLTDVTPVGAGATP